MSIYQTENPSSLGQFVPTLQFQSAPFPQKIERIELLMGMIFHNDLIGFHTTGRIQSKLKA